MNNFNVISKKFYNQYRNYDSAVGDWISNLTEFTDRLQGNTGELLRLVERIEVGTIVNESQAIEMTFRENSAGTFAILEGALLDFVDEGLYNGASLSIDVLGTTVTGTCEGVTGSSNQELKIDSTGRTNLLNAGMVDGDINSEIVIKVSNHPTYLTYKYGINPNTSTSPNYQSPLDENEQSYQAKGILTGTPTAMTWVGKEVGSSMGDVTIEHIATTSTYLHEYEIVHTFKLPYYVEGQLSNITNSKNPDELQRSNSVRYGNGFFFGGTTNITVAQFEDLGGVGNVGYFGDNFNGFPSTYSVNSYLVTNSLGTGKLEATVNNTVTFSIATTGPAFTGGEQVILTHTKLPTQLEYSNQTETFDEIWLFENLQQNEGAGATSNSIITAYTVTLNAGQLDVSAVISYSAAQQTKLSDTANGTLFVDIATQNLSNPDTMDRGQIGTITTTYTEDTRRSGLITGWQPDIYNHWDFFSGSKFFTNFDGYDGDLIGMEFTFDTDVTEGAVINSMELYLVADSVAQKFQIQLPIPFASINVQTVTSGLYDYQLFDSTIGANLNIPITDDLGFINLATTTPAPSTPTQTWTGSIALRLGWQDWIANNSVPNTFFDSTEPNNNQNQKTSNYDTGSYDIKLMLAVNVGTDDGLNTDYELLSDASAILDFDDAGGSSFVGTTKLYDEDNDLTDSLFTDQQVRIEIEFAHTLGVLSKATTWGRIWIEEEDSTGQPFELSTEKDLTNPNSPLTPSDTLLSGNSTLVEITSVSNLVTLICYTNKDNIVDGKNYNIYGRLGNEI